MTEGALGRSAVASRGDWISITYPYQWESEQVLCTGLNSSEIGYKKLCICDCHLSVCPDGGAYTPYAPCMSTPQCDGGAYTPYAPCMSMPQCDGQ